MTIQLLTICFCHIFSMYIEEKNRNKLSYNATIVLLISIDFYAHIIIKYYVVFASDCELLIHTMLYFRPLILILLLLFILFYLYYVITMKIYLGIEKRSNGLINILFDG